MTAFTLFAAFFDAAFFDADFLVVGARFVAAFRAGACFATAFLATAFFATGFLATGGFFATFLPPAALRTFALSVRPVPAAFATATRAVARFGGPVFFAASLRPADGAAAAARAAALATVEGFPVAFRVDAGAPFLPAGAAPAPFSAPAVFTSRERAALDGGVEPGVFLTPLERCFATPPEPRVKGCFGASSVST